MVIVFSTVLAYNADAQKRKGKKKSKTSTNTATSAPTPTPASSVTEAPAEPPKKERPKIKEGLVDGAYKREHFEKKPPVPLAFTRQADAVYSWNVLRVVDLSQKSNLPLTYPKSRLIDVMLNSLKSGKLEGVIFSEPELIQDNAISSSDVLNTLTKVDTVQKTDLETGEVTFVPQKTEFNPEDVIKYRIKEEWFFDKNYSSMQVRIIAIAPVKYLKSEGQVIGEQAMFWVYYPSIREDLAATEVFNWQNDGNKISFDDFFIKRLFSSYIYKESDVKDRRIEDYKTGKDILKEADRVKNKILDVEMALWEY